MVKLKNGNILIPNFEKSKHYELELNGEYQSNGYFVRTYLLKCNDYREVEVRANYVKITIYYVHKEYSLEFALYKMENEVCRFANGESFKYKLAKNTDRFSMAQVDELLKVLSFNFENFIHCLKSMNKGLEV